LADLLQRGLNAPALLSVLLRLWDIERAKIVEQQAAGANAVLNVRFSTSSITQGAAELFAYGTAVVVE
jgi:hypothetical protein